MDYKHLGRSGLLVSPLALGTMNFGPQASEEDSFRIMDRALEHGINFFDTANSYGGRGKTEEIVGRWLRQGGGRREKVVLATKVYAPMGDWPNMSKLSALHIRQSCDDSLRRLQTDHIDVFWMHHVDRATPWDEIWQAMEVLVTQGKVIYVGSSNFAGWHIAQANDEAKHRNFFGLVAEQSIYNLAVRTVELEVLPACQAYGMGVIPWSPLYGGMLSGRALQNASSGRTARQDTVGRIEKHRSQIEEYEQFCAEIDKRPADVALAWVMANPAVTAPLIGPRTMEQLDAAVKVLDLSLSPEEMQRLDEIFPGPGGVAPEAYCGF
jgi:NDP-hexose C3-ketoreductase / dTDP-4-oxo-2-deoxy-alpha-D-pentos-2-ene 2,3-reductase